MIRRHVGNELWLITQNDHAIVAGRLAEQFGGDRFDAPLPATIRGTALHDCGWALHDDEPTLNPDGLPRDVFETPPQIGLRVWAASAERAIQEDSYAGLLVSLHSLSLSMLATAKETSIPHERFDMSHSGVRFEVNRFQQRQIELQEQVRRQLEMRIDEPRRFGLAEDSTDPREQQLIFDFRLLQAMDKLSLDICCTAPPMPRIEPLLPGPHAPPVVLNVKVIRPGEFSVSPWPFKVQPLVVSVPFRRLPNRGFANEDDLRAVLASTPAEQFTCTLRA